LKKNIEVTEKFIGDLGVPEISKLGSAFVWKNIKFPDILVNLLDQFSFQKRARVFNEMKAFAAWIQKVSAEEELDDWNVIVAGLGEVNDSKNEKVWKLPQGSVGKINRSKKKSSDEKVINIGVLRAPIDLLADVPHNIEKLDNSISKENIQKIRAEAGLDRTPQLIIYRISKDSLAREKSKGRLDLNAVEDIIGLSIIIPGTKSRTGNAAALTVKIDSNAINSDDDDWRDED
jgi:hypothetical protein